MSWNCSRNHQCCTFDYITSPQTVKVFSKTHPAVRTQLVADKNCPQCGHSVCIIHHDIKRQKQTTQAVSNAVQA